MDSISIQLKDRLEGTTNFNTWKDEDDLLQTTIDGIPSLWETFLDAVNEIEENPNFEILWNDCIQEEGCIHNKLVSTKN